jgi:hypothetical protein
VVGGRGRGDSPPSKNPEFGAVLVMEKNVPHVPPRGAWFGCGFSRGCSSGSKAGSWPVPARGQPEAQDPPPPGALTALLWQVKPPLAPGGLAGHCLRAPISQRPGTTGCNENKAFPFPRHDKQRPAARRGASRVWHPSGGFWGPVLPPPRRPRIGHGG